MKKNLLISLGTFGLLAAMLGAWELYLRVRYPMQYVRDPELEYRLPEASPKGDGFLRFRERDYAVARTAGVKRILALGESTTWGHLVDGDGAWPALYEKKLNEKDGPEGGRAEVINAGVPGWSCPQIRLAARRWVPRLKPDVVLVMTGWNWAAIGEPLSWCPFPRLPARYRPLQPLVDSRLFVDLYRRFGAWLQKGIGPDQPVPIPDYIVLRARHEERLKECVRELGSELAASGSEEWLIMPPSLLAEPLPSDADPAEALKLLEPFSACQAGSLEEFRTCHAAERSTMRAGLEAGAKLSRWRVLDGEVFAPADWKTRTGLFADHNHLSPKGNRRFADWLAGQQ